MLTRLKRELHYYLVEDREAGLWLYLMGSGAIANVVVLGYGVVWLYQHLNVRIV